MTLHGFSTLIARTGKALKLHFSLLFISIILRRYPPAAIYLLQIDNYDKRLSGINYCEDKLNRWKMCLLHYTIKTYRYRYIMYTYTCSIDNLMSFVYRYGIK